MRKPGTVLANTTLQWTLTIAAGFTTMAVFLFVFIYWQTAIYEQNRIDRIVEHQAQRLMAAPAEQVAQIIENWLADDAHDVRYAGLFQTDGRRENGNLRVEPDNVAADGLAHSTSIGPIGHDHDEDAPELVRAALVVRPDGRRLIVGYDIDELVDVQAIIFRALGLSVIPAVLLSLLAGITLTRRGQRRVAAVHDAVGRIMAGQLRERLPVRGTADEFDKLATAVNAMLERIETLVVEIRGVGDNIAHDLRTPLTRVRTRLERSREEDLTREAFQASTDRAIASVDQALGLVTAVLRIGEITHARRYEAFTAVNLSAVLRDAVELYEPFAEERDVSLRLCVDNSADIQGDRDLLLEAISNLIDNAIKFAPAKTEVEVSLHGDENGLHVKITDKGPGIAPTDRRKVLERFYRADKSRSVPGNGLGLSLVSAVVALHGFRLHIDDANPGCVIIITSPTKLGNSRMMGEALA